jgi:hypothetical protein
MKKLTVPKPSTPSVWPTRKELDLAIGWMEWLVTSCEAFKNNTARLKENPADAEALEDLDDTFWHYKDEIEKMGGLDKLDQTCNPDFWTDKNAEPKRSEVAKMIGGLVGSFPTSNVKDPEVFCRNLLDDVLALRPFFVVLETTCRSLRTSQKFMPTISEVIAEYKKQVKIWQPLFEAFYCVNYYRDDAVTLVTSIAKPAQAQLTNNPSAPLATVATATSPFTLGDRVFHKEFGQGNVVKIDGHNLTIAFDKPGEKAVINSFVDACAFSDPPVGMPVSGDKCSDDFG